MKVYKNANKESHVLHRVKTVYSRSIKPRYMDFCTKSLTHRR